MRFFLSLEYDVFMKAKATDVPENFGRRLAALIAWLRIEQIQLAEAAKMSKSTISALCCGRIEPTAGTVLLLKTHGFSAGEWAFLVGDIDDITQIPQRVQSDIAATA